MTSVAAGTLRASSGTEVSSKILATIDDIVVSAGDQVEKRRESIFLVAGGRTRRRCDAVFVFTEFGSIG
jgi:hypothetical protein